MGRVSCAANFIDSINGKAEALSKPHEAFLLMKIIDAIYESAAARKPVQIY
jgi:predicted dehydrogenase